MKWLVLAFFVAASLASMIWYESAERKFTRPQQTAIGVAALTAWFFVLLLGNTML